MNDYDSKFDTANLGQIYNNYDINDDYIDNRFSFEYPWYLSIWFIFTLSALSFLIIPGLIAIFLIKKREDMDEKTKYYFEQLEYQKKEIEKIYEKRDEINKFIEEEKQRSLNYIEEEKKALLNEAELEAYNIVQSAEKQRSHILSDFKSEEDRIRRRIDNINIYEKRLEKNMEDIIRKLNLFCGNINDFRKTASPKSFKDKYEESKSKFDTDKNIYDEDFLKSINRLNKSDDDLSNTLKIRNNDQNN